MCGLFHTNQFLNFQQTSTGKLINLTKSQHYPPVDIIRSHRLRSLKTGSTSDVNHYQPSHELLLRFGNLLEWLTEPWEVFADLLQQDTNQEQADGRDV